MIEQSAEPAEPRNIPADHRCAAGRSCRNTENIDGEHLGAPIETQTGLCNPCSDSAAHSIKDLRNIWLALHAAIGEHTHRHNQKVSSSPTRPININTDVDALKTAIVEWAVAGAAALSEHLNIDDPKPRNHTDLEHARTIDACARIIGPHLATLLNLPAIDIMVWLAGADTPAPGEFRYTDEEGVIHYGVTERTVTGTELVLELIKLRHKARRLLALNNPEEKLNIPCPHCNEKELIRSHRIITSVSGKTKEIDEIDCSCGLNWPYERYRQLCLIWVKEDEMERDKLQKALDTEKKHREIIEWLLAERNWQLGLALSCTDISASNFARTVLTTTLHDQEDTLMTDRDLAPIIGVTESTIRSWAHQGRITKHVANDGAMVYLAKEVWDCAKTLRRTRRNPKPQPTT